MKKMALWKEVQEITGFPPQRARAIIRAARKALPYPQTTSTLYRGVRYGADDALLAGLKVAFGVTTLDRPKR